MIMKKADSNKYLLLKKGLNGNDVGISHSQSHNRALRFDMTLGETQYMVFKF